MIFLDDRVGSGELKRLFVPYGIQVESTRLEFGDCCFLGHCERGESTIGVERKRLKDLISSMRDRRLSGHQLGGLLELYEHVFLIVEGMYKQGENGEVVEYRGNGRVGGWKPVYVGSQPILYREIDNYLTTLELKAGVHVKRTARDTETVHAIVDLYRWFNDKTWDKHVAHDQIYAPFNPNNGKRAVFRQRKIRLVEKMAAQLPGVDRKAREVAEKFKTVENMVQAGEREWMKIKGIGKIMARRLCQAMREE